MTAREILEDLLTNPEIQELDYSLLDPDEIVETFEESDYKLLEDNDYLEYITCVEPALNEYPEYSFEQKIRLYCSLRALANQE